MRVTTIIPTYNRSWGLRQALESALRQDINSHEILVLDDCSEDDTPDVVASFSDERVVYTRQPQRRGMVGNWGDGLFRASGAFVHFLMDDDHLGRGFLARRLEVMSAQPDLLAVFARYAKCTRDGQRVGAEGPTATRLDLDAHDLLHAALSRSWFIGTTLYRTDCARRIWPRLEQDDLVLDYGLNIRLALEPSASGASLAVEDLIVTSHEGQNSVSRESEVFAQTAATLDRVRGEGRPPWAGRAIRRELANWHTTWGRRVEAEAGHRSARRHYWAAIATDPRLGWGWRQLGKSFMASMGSGRRKTEIGA